VARTIAAPRERNRSRIGRMTGHGLGAGRTTAASFAHSTTYREPMLAGGNADGGDGYPLHRRGVQPELLSDLAHTRPSRCPKSLLDSFPRLGVERRAAEPLAVPTGPLKAGADSLLDHRPFELGKDAQQGFAGRRVNGASHAERCLHATPTMV
jgi:hypothetical protein